MKKLKLIVIACKIEWHWLFIIPGRKKANCIIDELVGKGEEPLKSLKLTALVRRISRHCSKASVFMQKYNELAGIIMPE